MIRSRRMSLVAVCAIALGGLLSASMAPLQAHAQTPPPSSISGVGSVSPDFNIDLVGRSHTVSFTCAALTGCFNVGAILVDATTGAGPSSTPPTQVLGGTCTGLDGSRYAVSSGSEMECWPSVNPISAATATINPAQNHNYLVVFMGYVPATDPSACPAGTGPTPFFTTAVTLEPGGAPGAGNYCTFILQAAEHYLLMTNIALATVPSGSSCSATLTRGPTTHLLSGAPCTVAASITGTELAKVGVTCSTEPANGSPVGAPWPAGSVFNCDSATGNLTITNVPVSDSVPLQYTLTGPGGFMPAGSTAPCSGGGSASVTTVSGAPVTFCPNGVGTVSVTASLTGLLPDMQPPITSAAFTVAYHHGKHP